MRRGGMIAAAAAVAAALAGLAAGPASGSGGPPPTPIYIMGRGGPSAELARLHAGRTGIVMARSPEALLYLQWRLLHGLRVGPQAGAQLTQPCCEILAPAAGADPGGVAAWVEARRLVPGITALDAYLPTWRRGAYYSTIDNCFPDAFDTAASTLRDRAGRFGADTPAVRAWLAAQDAVFDACASESAALPPLPADAPRWLAADRAYQEAAFALYNMRNNEAAERFAAIARDRSSPWQPLGLYLRARALQRDAIALHRALGDYEAAAWRPRTPETLLERWMEAMRRQALLAQRPFAFARARAAIAAVEAAPAGTFGKEEARRMRRALAFRDRPAELVAELDRELNLAEPAGDLDLSIRDYMNASRHRVERRADLADWILTMQSEQRADALAHAGARWAESRDEAWLVAALSLARAGDPGADALAADAARVDPGRPAWLTAQYHLVRLTIAAADPAATRARLDSILGRDDLTLSERNLFTGARAQVAADLSDLARLALRRPYCIAFDGICEPEGAPDDEDGYSYRMLARAGGTGEWIGFGPEARAIIDRLPLDQRIALSRDERLPPGLRLDLSLTGFARAVQLQDEAAIGTLATDLAARLPAMRRDWLAIASLPPGPDRRFAEFFAMAKIPGLRTDLVDWDYWRPQGTVPQYQGQWVDWLILPRGTGGGPAARVASPAEIASLYPPLERYAADFYWSDQAGTSDVDLTCLGKCGRGYFALHLPRFVAAADARVSAERAHFLAGGRTDAEGRPRPDPAGALSVWDETLAWAQAHPRDPRSPEALYRLIRIARWGANHNHLGRRAFRVLHARYRGSDWARRSPYYFDD